MSKRTHQRKKLRQKNMAMFTLSEEEQRKHDKRVKRDRERHLSQYK